MNDPLNNIDVMVDNNVYPKRDSTLSTATGSQVAWQSTIRTVAHIVVSIHYYKAVSFDTESACHGQATGFIVDAKNGYILTPRHVIGPGPFRGYCKFDTGEETDINPIYCDPVHDFGYLRFDPSAIKHIQLVAQPLRPDLVKVGLEIRVIGNDSRQKLGVLQGVISRLDADAPEYQGYCDFNTNYLQASTSASGGSSGSPVSDINGCIVAMQTGGKGGGAATNYFLPLDRPQRTLKCIQDGKPITRGSIQCQWIFKPFTECRKLGLTPQCENGVRSFFPTETGMLVAKTVLPQGPSDNKIEVGDVLIKVNGNLVTQFIKLDDILDTSVGEKVKLLLQRGGEDLEVEIKVDDLHKITPDRFVSVAGAIFHTLSYQIARMFALACRGVFLRQGEGSFNLGGPSFGWIIQMVDKKETLDLESFIEVIKGILDQAKIVVKYKRVQDPHTIHSSIISIDRHWNPEMRLAVRNDTTGLWDFMNLADPIPKAPPKRQTGRFNEPGPDWYPVAVADLVRSFVKVHFYMPFDMDGVNTLRTCMGLVLAEEKGLVAVSRATIPCSFGNILITIAGSITVNGTVVFMHPLLNYAIIQYDHSLVDAPVKSAKLSKTYVIEGAEMYFMGHNKDLQLAVTKTTITKITPLSVNQNTYAPRYRAVNTDAIFVDTQLSDNCESGVLVGSDGVVHALWLTYIGNQKPGSFEANICHMGLATAALFPIFQQIQNGENPKLHIAGIEVTPISMSECRTMEVSEAWISKVAEDNPSQHQLFKIAKKIIQPGVDEAQSFSEGDIILSVDEKIITRLSDLHSRSNYELVQAKVVRNGTEISINVPTILADNLEAKRVLLFCGATFQSPHYAVWQQVASLPSDLYVSAWMLGSPARSYNLFPGMFVTGVNNVSTPTLPDFLTAISIIPDNTYFRLRAVTLENIPSIITLKKDVHYFPTVEWVKDDGACWRRVTHK